MTDELQTALAEARCCAHWILDPNGGRVDSGIEAAESMARWFRAVDTQVLEAIEALEAESDGWWRDTAEAILTEGDAWRPDDDISDTYRALTLGQASDDEIAEALDAFWEYAKSEYHEWYDSAEAEAGGKAQAAATMRERFGLPARPELDTTSSASRQHYIDTGRYLREGEAQHA